MLLAAIATHAAYADAQPRPEFAAAARERFLVATGQRLQEADEIDPSPRSSRRRACASCWRRSAMRRDGKRRRRAARAIAARPGARALMRRRRSRSSLFLGFSTYTVASASAALPGDWQYPVKLQTERVRLALAFSDDGKRDVRLDIADDARTRSEELTARGDRIGPGVLRPAARADVIARRRRTRRRLGSADADEAPERVRGVDESRSSRPRRTSNRTPRPSSEPPSPRPATHSSPRPRRSRSSAPAYSTLRSFSSRRRRHHPPHRHRRHQRTRAPPAQTRRPEQRHQPSSQRRPSRPSHRPRQSSSADRRS